MLRDLIILNPGMSRNQRKRLPDIFKIGGGYPSTIQKGNFMEYTLTIQTKNMINLLNKKRGI